MKQISILAFVLLFSFAARSQMTYLKAELQGSQEVPPTASTASGISIVKYNTTTKVLELTGNYTNLSSVITASHIHSPAPIGTNAPVLITLINTGGTTGTLSVTATLTPAQEVDLLAGNMYVNVHTGNIPSGEIRGQLTATTAGQSVYMTGRVQGAQEVPPNGSTAMGTVTTLLDRSTNMVYLTGSYSGLTTAANASHIHRAPVLTAGDVFVSLVFTPATSGTIHVASAVSETDEAEMVAGNSYVNIHTATYPGGEIRGQLTVLAQQIFLKAVLQGAQEVPANTSPGRGTVIVRYNTQTKTLELFGDYQNVASAVTASHIHSPAAPGTNAGILFPITNTAGTSGGLSATAILTPAQEVELLTGLMYVNVHTTLVPGGEIRGQLTTTTAGQTQFLTGMFSGGQEVPANTSTATGAVVVLLDKATNEVFLTGTFTGLTTNASAAHIHRGPAGVAGPVSVPISFTPAMVGTVTGNATVSSSLADSMIAGNTYVNVHNATFPGGEIRAQLGNLVLPLTFKYFNGYKQSNKVALVWESAQEQNLSYYEVEQQLEPGQWIKKATVAASGGNTGAKYSLTDEPATVKGGYVIYRLKMVDIDKKFSYSSIIKLNFAKVKGELFITTNPVYNGELRYNITGLASDKKIQVSVIDYMGRVLLQKTASSITNNNLKISALPAGMYRLQVRSDDMLLQKSFTK